MGDHGGRSCLRGGAPRARPRLWPARQAEQGQRALQHHNAGLPQHARGTHASVQGQASFVRAWMRACLRACVRRCVRAQMRACVRLCMHVCVRACVRACVHACVHACANARACVGLRPRTPALSHRFKRLYLHRTSQHATGLCFAPRICSARTTPCHTTSSRGLCATTRCRCHLHPRRQAAGDA